MVPQFTTGTVRPRTRLFPVEGPSRYSVISVVARWACGGPGTRTGRRRSRTVGHVAPGRGGMARPCGAGAPAQRLRKARCLYRLFAYSGSAILRRLSRPSRAASLHAALSPHFGQ